MNDPNDIKEELINLVYAGRKEEAIQLLQQKHGATREEAEQLLKLAVKETHTPVDFFKRAARASSTHVTKGKGCQQTVFGLIAFGFGFFGVPMLLAAAGIFIYQLNFISNSTRIFGKVIVAKEKSDNNDTQMHSVITYEVDGKTYSKRSTVSSNTPQYYVHDPVPLFVNNEDPNDVLIDSFLERWLIITIVGSLGLFFTILMAVFIGMSRRK
ncbi:MAG TPA: DUF3592 domain-containing protein [Cyclobacteriaceae bacterium]|nr:DUF3592 domain-containing protein [Cyclobacteriaceae bacterium]